VFKVDLIFFGPDSFSGLMVGGQRVAGEGWMGGRKNWEVAVSGSHSLGQGRGESQAEKKARLAYEKSKEKEEEKERVMMCKIANNMIGKLGPQIVQLETLTGKPELQFVASVIRDPILRDFARFKQLHDNAKEVIDTSGHVPLQETDVKALQADIASSKKNIALACQILATVARAG
jgi:hypothetical protein